MSFITGKSYQTNVVARKNKIINGNFDIWQRGTIQIALGYGSDDRWFNGFMVSSVSHSRNGWAPGDSPLPGNPKYYSSTAVTSVANASAYSYKSQKIEGVGTFSGETVTLSFWAKADAAKNIAVEFVQDFGSGGTPSAQVTGIGIQHVQLGTAWQKHTITVTIPSISGKTLGTDGDDYLALFFWFEAGSSLDARTLSLGQQSGTFDIAQVQLEEGAVATEFEQRHVGEELALCQRYYQQRADAKILWTGDVTNASTYHTSVDLPVPMRVSPTVVPTFNAGAGFSAPVNVSAPGSTSSKDHLNFSCTANATQARGYFQFTFTADAEL